MTHNIPIAVGMAGNKGNKKFDIFHSQIIFLNLNGNIRMCDDISMDFNLMAGMRIVKPSN